MSEDEVQTFRLSGTFGTGGGELSVGARSVTVKRGKSVREIPFASIKAVYLKKPGLQAGYLAFTTDHGETDPGPRGVAHPTYTKGLLVGAGQAVKDALAAKELIDERMVQLRAAGEIPEGGVEETAENQRQFDKRDAAFAQAQRDCPLPISRESVGLPGGLSLFEDEFLVTTGKDWGLSSQRLSLTTHRIIYSRGRLGKSQESCYLVDVRDVKFHKPMVGLGMLTIETAAGGSIEGLPAMSNGAQFRDQLLSLVHFARQRAAQGAAQPFQVQAVSVAPPDRYDQLRKLADLKAQGILTEEEFAAEKAKLLGGAQ
jgi:hypothetical protein